MTEEIEKLIAAKERALGFGDYDNWQNDQVAELMNSYADSVLERFVQTLKDIGFCPDEAYSNHVHDVYRSFDKHQPIIEES